jgi:hypothetical protein
MEVLPARAGQTKTLDVALTKTLDVALTVSARREKSPTPPMAGSHAGAVA